MCDLPEFKSSAVGTRLPGCKFWLYYFTVLFLARSLTFPISVAPSVKWEQS